MLDVILQILSVLGIILLVLLAVLITALLLVLFFPVLYRVKGRKDTEHIELAARADWLFGLLRLRYAYPEPGKLTVKVLWITVFDSSDKREESEEKEGREEKEEQEEREGREEKERRKEKEEKEGREEKERKKEKERRKESKERIESIEEESKEASTAVRSSEIDDTEGDPAPKTLEQTEGKQNEKESDDRDLEAFAESKEKSFTKISEKIAKLKYTILTIYDKIKKMWQNISYYLELLNDKDTKLLLLHAKIRLCKIIKSIRPRKLEADIVLGTGAPDTTGYAYGVYGMLMPFLGSYVVVRPDFQRVVLEGNFQASGHVTLAVLLWQAMRIAMDKKLWQLLDKLKRQGTEQDKKAKASKGHRQ